jgi:hypothetical protein
MIFGIEKRIFVVKSYYKSENLVTVRRVFKKRFDTKKLL